MFYRKKLPDLVASFFICSLQNKTSNNTIMENTQAILHNYSDEEKGAYLTAIASIATADTQVSEEEIEGIQALCQSADLSDAQTAEVLSAAETTDSEKLRRSLDIIKGSELKYALVTDLISFAKLDSDYSEAEQKSVQSISEYLGVNQNQFSLLNQFTDQTANSQVSADDLKKPGFLSSLGIEDKLKNAGINSGGLLKSLLTIAAPMILTKMIAGGTRRNGNSNSGGGMFGNNRGGMGGGIGSVISMLNGGRGFGNAGGLLGSLFCGRR